MCARVGELVCHLCVGAKLISCAINHKMRLGDDWQIRRVSQMKLSKNNDKNCANDVVCVCVCAAVDFLAYSIFELHISRD